MGTARGVGRPRSPVGVHPGADHAAVVGQAAYAEPVAQPVEGSFIVMAGQTAAARPLRRHSA